MRRRTFLQSLPKAFLASSVPMPAHDPPGALPAPPWTGGVCEREALLFIRPEGEPPSAALLFVPARILEIRSADGETRFEPGRDYRWRPGSRVIELSPGSRIPFKERAQMYPPKGAPMSIGEALGGRTNLFWSESDLFHRLQAEATYEQAQSWAGPRPAFAGAFLPRVTGALRAGRPLKIVVLGDSISEGYNASGKTGAPPHQPAYPGLLAEELTRRHGAPVRLANLSVAGKASDWALTMAPAAAAERPDLLVLAFGMNDASGRRLPSEFAGNLRAVVDRVRVDTPACEVILVATMTGNPEWSFAAPDLYPRYRTALRRLEGPGVAVADLTGVWTELLRWKRFADLTGNGVNHPNDYGHRLYAAWLVEMLSV